MKDKQIAFAIPDWVKPIKDDDVAGAIVGLMFSWAWDNKEVKIPNLREYIKGRFDDLTDKQVEELIEHEVVRTN